MIFSSSTPSPDTFAVKDITPDTESRYVHDFLIEDLIERERSLGVHYLPASCRYVLYDERGRSIYSSQSETIGSPIPEIRPDNPYIYWLGDWRLRLTTTHWRLQVDIDKMVPDHLRHLAVKAKVFTRPDVDYAYPLEERLERTIRLTPSEASDSSDSTKPSEQSDSSDSIPQILAPDFLPLSQKNSNFAPDMETPVHNDDFLAAVSSTISERSLLRPGDKVIVALSGGADSVALLAALVDLGYDCVAAHCNFRLRGAESQRDMLHAQKICKKLGVNFTARDFDVEARRRLTGESTEMACRSLRYEWFDRLMTDESARAVAVAHHREDNVETVLLNLCRTTGIDGLRGIRYRRDYVIRPLLDCSREQIERFLTRRGLSFVVDSSNRSDAYLRNRMRNRVIPELLRNFPDAERSILSSIANIDAAARIYHRAVDGYRHRFVGDNGRYIDLAALKSELGADTATVLREFLKDAGASMSQCNDIVTSSDRTGLRFPTSSGSVIELDRGVLTINGPTGLTRPSQSDAVPVDLRRDILTPVNLRISRHHVSEFAPKRDPNVLYLDSSALEAGQWALRKWRRGDRMHPFGMNGTRLVSDIFSDAKYSAADKRAAWLLTCDDSIVWVVGLRASSDFNVGPPTRQFLKILYNP